MLLCRADADCPSGERCDATVDGPAPDGYPCFMQPGFGPGMAPRPLYEWNNRMSGSVNVPSSNVDFRSEDGVVVIGRSADTLARFPAKVYGQLAHDLAFTLSRVWPNLHVYVPPRPLLTGEAPGVGLGAYLAMAALASVAWSAGLIAAASFIFKKRDFL